MSVCLVTSHVLAMFCWRHMSPSFFAYVGSLQHDADFLFAGYNPILVEAKLIFLIYLQTRCWIEEISLVAGEGEGVFRNKQVGFSFLENSNSRILLLLSECSSHWVFRTWLLLAPILSVLFLSLIVSHQAEVFSFWLWEHCRVLVLVHLFNDRIKSFKTKEWYQACLFVEAFILISVQWAHKV